MPSAASLAYQAAKQEIVRRERLRKQKQEAESDFLAFIRMMWPVLEADKPFIEGWVINLLCDVMMALTDGDLQKVCINVPPGSMKSTILNVMLPAWHWGPCNMPNLRYLTISYSTVVPIRDNLRFARLIKSEVYKSCWGDRFKLERDGAEWVGNDRTGWKAVTSVTGSTTGLRGDYLLLDDLNNPMDVESELNRDTTNRFVREIMPSRLNDVLESRIINLQQRTHELDATGTLLEHGKDWTFICVPAEFDPLRIYPVVLRRDENGEPEEVWVDPRSLGEDGRQLPGLTTNKRGELVVADGSPMLRAQGETFWPERFPNPIRAHFPLMTDYSWDSQFNQIPGVRGGGSIRRDWWRLWSEPDYPDVGTVIVSLDTATEEHSEADFNALTVWGAFAGREGEPLFLLMDAWRERLPLARLVFQVAQTCRKWKADYLLIEHRTRGRDVHDEIQRLYGAGPWETVLVKVSVSKLDRVKAVSHFFSGDFAKMPTGAKTIEGRDEFIDTWSGGVVYAPAREWADVVIDEMASFPFGKHDDYVDACSMALGFARKNGVVLRKVEWDSMEYERNLYRKPMGVPYAIRRA